LNISIYTFQVVNLLSLLTVVGQLILIILGGSILLGRNSRLLHRFDKKMLVLMLCVALIASLGSLFLSEIATWNPCKYCWIQRIFMYPQVFLLAIALWKKDRSIAPYILTLSIIGLLYAGYHYYIQMQNIIAAPDNPATPCDASGESCVKTPFVVFGYITIPLMAFTAFALNAVGSLIVMRAQKTK